MNKLFLSTTFLFLSLFSFAQNEKIIKDTNAQVRNAKGFHAISISSGIDLYLSQGEESVAVSASDSKDRDRIKVDVEDGVLRIYMEDNNGIHWNLGNKKWRAYVSYKTLDKLHASGGSDVFSTSTLKLDNLEIHLSGGSDLKAMVSIQNLSIHQSGGSDVNISGNVANLKITASGGSDFHGYDLVSDNCEINASGGSDMRITVNKELKANASGGSDVYYKGTGVVKEMRSSGSSSISKKG
jgi:hypothetical protein